MNRYGTEEDVEAAQEVLTELGKPPGERNEEYLEIAVGALRTAVGYF